MFIYYSVQSLLCELRFIEQTELQMSFSLIIIHLTKKKIHSWRREWVICSNLPSVISLLLSICNIYRLISFISKENVPFISWKSNSRRRMRRSTVENWILHVGNVWNKINAPSFWENGRIMAWKDNKPLRIEKTTDDERILWRKKDFHRMNG